MLERCSKFILARFIILGLGAICFALWYDLSFINVDQPLIWHCTEMLSPAMVGLSAFTLVKGKKVPTLILGISGIFLMIKMIVVGLTLYLPFGFEPYRSTYLYILWFGTPILGWLLMLISLLSIYISSNLNPNLFKPNIINLIGAVPIVTVLMIHTIWLLWI